MQIVKGDLFDAPQSAAIGHGVNCKGVMGRGIAVQFKQQYPDMFNEYKKRCKNKELVPGDIFPYFDEEDQRWVYNIASQDGYTGFKPAKLEWLSHAVGKALDHAAEHGVSELHLPLIGAGLGGLQEQDVLKTLESVERNRTSSIVVHIL